MQNDPLWIREQLKVASSTVLKQDESKTCNRTKTNIFKPITKTEFDHTWVLLYKRVRKRHFFLIYFNWMETKLRIFKSMFRSSLYGSSESQNLDVLLLIFDLWHFYCHFSTKMILWPKWLTWEILWICECCIITCQDGNSAFKFLLCPCFFRYFCHLFTSNI